MRQSTKPGETCDWYHAYACPQLTARRMRTHRQKLARLGVFSWPREPRILDLCCGTGEVLRILRSEGFQNPAGIDAQPGPDLSGEGFDVKTGDARALPYEN